MYQGEHFVKLPKISTEVLNLYLILKNRKNAFTYIISNDINTLICAMRCGFCLIPVVNSPNSESFELHILELYILKIRKHKNFSKLYNI